MTGFIVSVFPFRNRVSSKEAFEGLELGERKLSRPVLRGPGGRKVAWLLGNYSPGTIDRSYAIHIAIHISVVYDVLPMTCSAVRICNPPTFTARPDGTVGNERASEGTGRNQTIVLCGGVVQLVSKPACHAGGRGFESRNRTSPPLDQELVSSRQGWIYAVSSVVLELSRVCTF
jgi:hypothetical protein